MPVSELLMEGLTLMLLGMGIVFTFLAILVFALRGMSRLAGMLEPEGGAAATSAASGAAQAVPATTDNSELIAVISAAVSRYRAKHR